jgi:hypothetical protein
MNLFDDCRAFEIKSGKKFYLINDSVEGRTVKAWLEINKGNVKPYRIDLVKTHVDVEILKEIKVWNELSKSIQDEIIESQEVKKEIVKEKMAAMRGQRKKKYDHLPQEMVCKCGSKTKANWSYLNSKADKLGCTGMDLVKNYQCQKCNPTKGRRKKK